ncbi:DUF4258 domain-containing protein [Desulfobacterium sp. N47]|uniref:DUF4258 domain-containing protein n=1 Tax=uncultured Desulfobacterium sp. TaxID=201089 RepID=E1YJV3_9BACT|nr:hypothetical protein N47_E50690 [uncultured Desulfobacterium sp.]
MNYKLTQHAKDAIIKRKVELKWIEQAVSFPQHIEQDATDSMLEHRMAVIPENESRVLRVIINPHTNPLLVVTLFFDRRMKGKL